MEEQKNEEPCVTKNACLDQKLDDGADANTDTDTDDESELVGEFKLPKINYALISELSTKKSDVGVQKRNVSALLNDLRNKVNLNKQQIEDFPITKQQSQENIFKLQTKNRCLQISIKNHQDRILKHQKEIDQIHKKQRLRAELKGQQFVPGNGLATEAINKNIKDHELNISLITKEINDNDLEIKNLITLSVVKPKQINVKPQLKQLNEQYEDLEMKENELKRMIKEEVMRNDYIKYIYSNFYIICSQDDIDALVDGTHEFSDDMFKMCNEHHQSSLLSNYHDDNPPSVDGCEDCTGWSVNSRRCDCGNFKGYRWNTDDDDISDILEFDITEEQPAGYVERMW